MKNWRHVLWADLGLAIVFALFMFAFFNDAVGKVFGGAVGLAIGAIAGILTFMGGARIAFGLAHRLRDRPPTAGSDPELQWDGSRRPNWTREPLLTDVIMVIVGLVVIAVGYTRQFSAIDYAPGDVRGTPGYDASLLTVSVVIGLFAIVVGSIRLVQGLRRRRQ